ncbi:MAG TPA: helix-turn-helix domain-containing protein [Gaiellaceae bacterium]|jgi:AcrR family transcriptional regulator|nr:helix-turn-helix domain-containing protein [Gaiellaceae bacterium]HEX2496880.1 helix-turn-helix domain-containing protein [Gaiellaceae bacterium]
MATTTRHTAEERRESILEAATIEFAAKGLHGTSTEDVARRAGISQPYVFRLFGTKKRLFAETCRACMREVRETMAAAADGVFGEEAFQPMGRAYAELLAADPRRLNLQMQMYAACDEPEIREVAQEGYGELVRFIEARTGASRARISQFFGKGMLMNVLAAMEVKDAGFDWADRLEQGCLEEE